MITYRDMTFCSNKDCTFTQCPRHASKVPWDKLPEYMCVSMSDFTGKENYCYRQKAEKGKENAK